MDSDGNDCFTNGQKHSTIMKIHPEMGTAAKLIREQK